MNDDQVEKIIKCLISIKNILIWSNVILYFIMLSTCTLKH